MLAAVFWQAPLMLPVAVAVIATLAAFVLWLYPPQVRSLSRTWRWLLPGLRIIALAALVVSLLKPVIIRPKTVNEQGAVVLLIDRSRSMGVTDTDRTPAERVALAAGLGLLPPDLRSDATAQLMTQLDEIDVVLDDIARAQREVEYARLSGRGVESAGTRLEERIDHLATLGVAFVGRARGLPQAQEALPQLAAFEQLPSPLDDEALTGLRDQIRQVRADLSTAGSAADAALYESNTEVRRIADALAGRSRLELVRDGLTDGRVLAGLPSGTPVFAYGFDSTLTPLPSLGDEEALSIREHGTASNLTGAIGAALEQLRGRPVQAVVLLSDGRQVGGNSDVASSVAPSGVPVFAVNAAGPLRRDLAIVGLDVPLSQFVGETITVRARVHATGMAGQAIQARLDAGDVHKMQSATVGEDDMATIPFELKATEAGIRTVAVAAEPVAGEITADNNRMERQVKVLQDKIAVAALSGTAGWDYQYVRNALSRTPWVNLTDAIFRTPQDALDMTPEALLEQAVVILSDVSVDSLSPQQWDAIHRMVTERGGSVILMAGEPRMVQEFQGDVLLSDLLPYRAGLVPAWRLWPGEEPNFRLVPAPDARDNPALRLTNAIDTTGDRWAQMPAMFSYLPIPELKPNTRPLLIERDSGDPVLTESRLGSGRVLFMGTDETWRWRNKVGERDHDRFWLQMIRSAADEPYAATDSGLFLDVDRVQSEPGQPLRVRAKVLNGDGTPSALTSRTVQVLRDGQLVREIALATAGLPMGRYETVLDDLQAGQYELRLSDGRRTVTLPISVAAATETEMMDLSPDEALLRRLAEASGGQVLSLEQLSSLPGRISDVRNVQNQLAEYRLWDSPYLFVLVLGCLTAEWALRKRVGLA